MYIPTQNSTIELTPLDSAPDGTVIIMTNGGGVRGSRDEPGTLSEQIPTPHMQLQSSADMTYKRDANSLAWISGEVTQDRRHLTACARPPRLTVLSLAPASSTTSTNISARFAELPSFRVVIVFRRTKPPANLQFRPTHDERTRGRYRKEKCSVSHQRRFRGAEVGDIPVRDKNSSVDMLD